MMNASMDQLLTIGGPLAYLVVGVLVFAEAAVFLGFVLPGETAVLFGGVLATGQVSLPVLLVVVVVAAVTGDSVGFEVGHRFGPRVLKSRILRRHQTRLDRARLTLREHGGWAA